MTFLLTVFAVSLSLFSQTVETVSTGLSAPLGMALNGNDLYVGQWGAGTISKIDISQPLPIPVTSVLSGLNSPTGLLVIGNHLYICAENNLPGISSSVGRIDLTNPSPVIEMVASNINSSHITQAFCRKGNDLYISCSSTNAALQGIYKLDLTASFPQTATQIVSNFPCSGMAIKGNELYVGYFNGATLYKLDLNQSNPVPVGIASGLNGPDGLVFNGNYLYICEAIGTTIKRMDVTQTTPVLQNVVTGLAEPTYVAFDGVDMYFAEYAGGKVSRVTINQPVFSGQPNVCANSVPANLGGASPTGGIYSGPGVTNNGDGTTFMFNPAVAGGVGNYTITYTIGGGSATSSVQVVSAPAVTFTPPASVQVNSGILALNGSPAGGTYSGFGVSGSNFDPVTAGVGSHTITYTYSDGNGCSETVSATVNVTSLCPPGGVTFNTQAQLDQFIIDYPNCTQIVGNTWIEGSDITDLSPLQNITSVGGYLVVENNAVLTNVDGLNNIATLGADLTIRGNTLLTNLDGLTGLTTISGWLTVDDNTDLTDISGLESVSSGIENLVITDNPALAVCDLPNFCSHLAASGPRNISGNLADCVNEQAVIDACNAPAAGCLTASSSLPQWPSATFTPACNGTGEVIATDTWTGEYSKVNVTAGIEYTFSSSVATDYVTISDENGNTVNAHGDSPLTWTASANATLRFYLHLDDQCNWGDNTNRSRIVKCNDPLSVSDADLAGLTYYPNPVTDVLTVMFERTIDEVAVINLTGQQVSIQTVNAMEGRIDMGGMPSGSYFIRVKSDGVIRTLKVLKH